ncbi:MAG: hypothetical protein ACOWWO_14155 [Peptococcaceae bacterium]
MELSTTSAAVLTLLQIERSFGNEVWRLTANEIIWSVYYISVAAELDLLLLIFDRRSPEICLQLY